MSAFKSIHKYYSNCHDDNGNFNNEKAKELIKSYVYYGNERLEILKSIYDSVLGAKFINKFSRMYLTNSNMTIRDIGKNYNENLSIGEEIVKEGTCRSQISYCSTKVNEVFNDLKYGKETFDIITWLIDANTFRLDNDSDKQRLHDDFLGQLSYFVELYIDRPAISKKDLVIQLPRCDKVNEVDQKEFEEFMEMIKPYSWSEVRKVQLRLNDYIDCIGYLKYIMTARIELSGNDRDNKSHVLSWLGKESDAIDNIKNINDKIDKDIKNNLDDEEKSNDNEDNSINTSSKIEIDNSNNDYESDDIFF